MGGICWHLQDEAIHDPWHAALHQALKGALLAQSKMSASPANIFLPDEIICHILNSICFTLRELLMYGIVR